MSRRHHHSADNRCLALQRTMTDARGREVVFLSHCLLNQNTRYLGGASCPGVVSPTVLPYVDAGVGIVQMPCPEQQVWGGVLKRHLLWLLTHPRLVSRALPLMPLAERYIRLRYAVLARVLAREVQDYASSGYKVRAIVGVAGSPSCGVHTTMDMRQAAAAMAARSDASLTADWFNNNVVKPATCPGRGLFTECLGDALAQRRLAVPFQEPSAVGDYPNVTGTT